ncbi:MAG: SPOR domain-containing protein [Deltaproteobacteria bacterium]|nr:SPOR domain-containing protein [Deltaproteobacteria bacterium]
MAATLCFNARKFFSFLVWASLGALILILSACGVTERIFPSDHSGPAAKGGSQPASSVSPQPGSGAVPVSLGVKDSLASGGVAPVESSLFSDFRSVWVGSYLDPEPALKAAESFQKKGLVAFSVKKKLEGKGLFSGEIGEFFLVLVGLFGEYNDAEALGKLLTAQGEVANWQIVSSEQPSELNQIQVQTAQLVKTSEQVTETAQNRAGRPSAPDSPAVTGAGFKNLVRGRFIGSFRDPLEARREAERLTGAGWPAAVETDPAGGGLWYRVYLAEAADRREFKAKPEVLAEAKASAASREGLVFLIDTSGLKGSWGQKQPDSKRLDASACAGFSRTGRLLTSIERLVGYVPENGALLTVVKPISYNEPANVLDWATRPVKVWWTGDDSELANTKSVYGPTLFRRPDVMSRIKALNVQTRSAPIAPGLDNLTELASISGRKTIVLYSEFGAPDGGEAAAASVGRLKAFYGSNLKVVVVYGDTDDLGWQMAENLAKAGGSGQAWNGCRLLIDNSYFENFVKTVFPK